MGSEHLGQLLGDPSALPVESIEHVRCELGHGRKTSGHSERVAVVSPTLGEVWFSARVQQLHHVGAASECSDGKAASDDLAKGGEIWCDAIKLLGSARTNAE